MTRIEKLQKKLPENACALITSDINRRYFTRMKSSAGVLLVSAARAVLLIDFRYFEKASETVTDCEVIRMTHMYEQIDELVNSFGSGTLMIEAETMTVAQLDKLWEETDPDVTIDSTSALSDIITEMRQIKSSHEIDMIKRAQFIAEYAFQETLNFIREGVTEKDIALTLNDYMLRNGAEDLSFETIALCGSTTSMPHGVPSDKPLKKGEFILMDFGAVFEGYHSDMTRTVVLGEPTEEMERVYSIVLEAQTRAIAAAKAGISGKRLDCAARDFISANGYGEYFGHGLGHSVGMEIHESPCANMRDDTILQENMIMTIEPGIYLPKKFGVRIEDFVVIGSENCINLTKAPKNLIKL
ncbi:MAG: M24 family metallopeptidase [Huintestinicola sp.]